MRLSLYNSLTSSVEPFIPQQSNNVTLYCCGVTVYDHCHLGHGRSVFVLYDMVIRLLQVLGYTVKAARNITDIDDKIIQKAKKSNTSCQDITQFYTQSMQQVMHQLRCTPPEVEPKATEAIPTMISLIQKLLEKGHAYINEGEVLFDISSFADYGKLSHQKLDELEYGVRVAEFSYKRHPGDFTLWKPSKEHEPFWDSPWGPGRPGWHLECSAMIEDVFHDTIDIHMGGADLKFPHHENEIAQSEACFHRPLAKTWMHVGFVTVDDEKMSKSLGNFHYLHDILSHMGDQPLRYFYLTSHYRQPLAFTPEKIEQASRTWNAINRSLARWLPLHSSKICDQAVYDHLLEALCDDLNTPELLARLHHHLKSLEQLKGAQAILLSSTLIVALDKLLGLTVVAVEIDYDRLSSEVQEVLAQRAQARQAKDYVLSDVLRKQLAKAGYHVIDTPQGQKCEPI